MNGAILVAPFLLPGLLQGFAAHTAPQEAERSVLVSTWISKHT